MNLTQEQNIVFVSHQAEVLELRAGLTETWACLSVLGRKFPKATSKTLPALSVHPLRCICMDLFVRYLNFRISWCLLSLLYCVGGSRTSIR